MVVSCLSLAPICVPLGVLRNLVFFIRILWCSYTFQCLSNVSECVRHMSIYVRLMGSYVVHMFPIVALCIPMKLAVSSKGVLLM